MALTLTGPTWNQLVDQLIEAEVITSHEDATTQYIGRGDREFCIGFTVGDFAATALQLGAALAEAFNTIPGLVELAADGIGVQDMIRTARTDSLGRGYIVYFPGHTVDDSDLVCGVCDGRGHDEHNCPI